MQYAHAGADSEGDDPPMTLEEMMSKVRGFRLAWDIGTVWWLTRGPTCAFLAADAQAVKPASLVRGARGPPPSSAARRRRSGSGGVGPLPQQVKQSSTLYRRHDTLLSGSPASDQGAVTASESGPKRLHKQNHGVDAHIMAAYMDDAPSPSSSKHESQTCWICLAGPREAVFLECGHGGVCYPCAEKCWNLQRKHGCPMCRQPVTQVVRVATSVREGKDGELVVNVIS